MFILEARVHHSSLHVEMGFLSSQVGLTMAPVVSRRAPEGTRPGHLKAGSTRVSKTKLTDPYWRQARRPCPGTAAACSILIMDGGSAN